MSYGKREDIDNSKTVRVQVITPVFEGLKCLSPTSVCYKENGVWRVQKTKEEEVCFQAIFKNNEFPSDLKITIMFGEKTADIRREKDKVYYTPQFTNNKNKKYDIIVEFTNKDGKIQTKKELMEVLEVLPPLEKAIENKNTGKTKITTIPQGIKNVRPKDSLKLKFDKRNISLSEEATVDTSTFIWKLNGKILSAKGEQIEIPREEIANCKKGNIVAVFKNLTDKKAMATYNFSVLKNKVNKFDISHPPKYGKEIIFDVKYTKKENDYMLYPQLEGLENVHWEVTKEGKLIKSDIGLEFRYTFKEEGKFKVKCYISDKEGEVEKEYNIIQPKIYPQSAKWVSNARNTNNKLHQAGYAQEICAYVEHAGLQGERVTLRVYDDDLLQDDEICKVENIEVKKAGNICIPIILGANEKRKIWDNEGKLYFTIEPFDKRIKVQDTDKELGKHLLISKERQVWATYFCNSDETEKYSTREVGMSFYFKLYATNLVGAKVEVCFLNKYISEKPQWKDCEQRSFFKGLGEIDKKGELKIRVDTSKLKKINKATYIYAVMAKFTYKNGDKEEVLYKHFKDRLLLFPTNSLPHMEENKSPVKVGYQRIVSLFEPSNWEEKMWRVLESTNKDCQIVFKGQTAKEGALSEKTKQILKEVGKASGNDIITITSTARTPYDQARIMYDNCKRNLKKQREVYARPGQKIIDVYVANKEKKKEEVIKLMEAKIKELGVTTVSKHLADFNILNTFDIPYNLLKDKEKFKQEMKKRSELDQFMIENNCYHIQIKQ
ncbi:hypothetical protein [Capnocytophaga catalasegens]|uniref:Ig-like domain-containing protein n=1 Tax=Capnocytophaga catalasegens TaxID=1004260 RepID=A0AAV5AW31_9FLAO|nr:hypothetical protein [Capnocytophaga catalasegens]GIZ16395.1 hypothetical protein RCZ03_23950 [Capnocytophaga catalasegens]GJM50056.1 hypothetical protein RCZ15_10300 [Capnocytophaga catalasegens]GJM52380.1 hypothetical protein RCZ16_06970 [Capnocytophaga catalasegens]